MVGTWKTAEIVDLQYEGKLVFLGRYHGLRPPHSPLDWLQFVRQPKRYAVTQNLRLVERDYYGRLSQFTGIALGLLESLRDTRLKIIQVPSGSNWADPYRIALSSEYNEWKDISHCVIRKENSNSQKDTLNELVDRLSIDFGGDKPKFNDILIVDDVLNTGKNIAALLTVLWNHECISHDTQITIFCPLIIELSEKKKGNAQVYIEID